MHLHSILYLLLLLTLYPWHGTCFQWANTSYFDSCYKEKIRGLKSNCSDHDNRTYVEGTEQVCVYKGQTLTNVNRIFITLDFCEEQCGDGYGIWPINDILSRLSGWVIPAIVLIAHFHFPPLGSGNKILVICHLLSDPIDSLWSLLGRMNAHRQLYASAKKMRLRSAGAVATIWAAYEELNYDDPREHFDNILKNLKQDHGSDFLRVTDSKYSVSRTRTMETKRSEDEEGVFPRLWIGRQFRKLLPRRWIDNDEVEDKELIELLSSVESPVLYAITKAAQTLVFNRSQSSFTTWVSIISMIFALMQTYIRTEEKRENNQTSHTIATVCLIFILVPLVKLSANIGAFTTSIIAVDVIQNLQKELAEIKELRGFKLFPNLDIFSKITVDDKRLPEKFNDLKTLKVNDECKKLYTWPHIAAYSGMNSNYRPQKTCEYPRLGLLSLFIVVAFCYTPALVISYCTPLITFGCRSFAWTLVLTVWCLNASLDMLAGLFHKNHPRSVWIATCVKDVLFTIFITILVSFQQLGLFNSCFCRSGALMRLTQPGGPSYINLTPLEPHEWDEGWKLWLALPITCLGCNLIFIFCVEWFFLETEKLLNRSDEKRARLLMHVKRLAPRDTPPNTGDHASP
jgi:hypothetical protein